MNELFDAVTSRLKTIFTAHAALELEAELINRHIERKAGLRKRASELEQQGLNDLAAELRQHASEVTLRKHTEAAQIVPCQGLPAPVQNNGPSSSDSNSSAKPTSSRRKP